MVGGIVQAFYLLFQSDTKDAEEGAKKVEETSGKAEKKLRDVDKAAKKSGDSFTALAKKAVSFLAPFVGLSAIKATALDFAASADAAGMLSKALNMDVEALQAWQGAAERSGGSASGMAASMQTLAAELREMQVTGGGEIGGILFQLGIDARDSQGHIKSADRVLYELSGTFEGLSQQRAIMLGEKLGLDIGTVSLLQQGKKGIDELLARQKELGLYSKKDTEDARKFNNVMSDMGQAFKSVARLIALALLPVFSAMSDGLTTFALDARKHKDLIIGFVTALSVVLGVMAVKAGIAFAPFILAAIIILALAAAFAILYDDVQAFLNGHNSMIGELSKDYPQLAEWVMDVVEVFGLLWDAVKAVGTLLVESIANPTRAWENFKNKIGGIVDKISEKFPRLGQAIKDVGDIFSWLFDIAGPILKFLFKFITLILEKVGGFVASLAGGVLRAIASTVNGENANVTENNEWIDPETGEIINLGAAQAAIAQTGAPIAAASPAALAPAGGSSGSVSLNVNELNVNTRATDAEGMARDSVAALEAQLEAVADQYADGVAD